MSLCTSQSSLALLYRLERRANLEKSYFPTSFRTPLENWQRKPHLRKQDRHPNSLLLPSIRSLPHYPLNKWSSIDGMFTKRCEPYFFSYLFVEEDTPRQCARDQKIQQKVYSMKRRPKFCLYVMPVSTFVGIFINFIELFSYDTSLRYESLSPSCCDSYCCRRSQVLLSPHYYLLSPLSQPALYLSAPLSMPSQWS